MINNTMLQMTAGITALVVVGAALALGTARRGPSDDLAAAGAPLYGKVVQESIRTLDQGGELETKSNVCPDCGQVHEPAAASPAAAPPNAATPNAAVRQPAVSAPVRQPVAAPADSYYCARCKIYHPRRPTPDAQGRFPDPHTVPLDVDESGL